MYSQEYSDPFKDDEKQTEKREDKYKSKYESRKPPYESRKSTRDDKVDNHYEEYRDYKEIRQEQPVNKNDVEEDESKNKPELSFNRLAKLLESKNYIIHRKYVIKGYYRFIEIINPYNASELILDLDEYLFKRKRDNDEYEIVKHDFVDIDISADVLNDSDVRQIYKEVDSSMYALLEDENKVY